MKITIQRATFSVDLDYFEGKVPVHNNIRCYLTIGVLTCPGDLPFWYFPLLAHALVSRNGIIAPPLRHVRSWATHRLNKNKKKVGNAGYGVNRNMMKIYLPRAIPESSK